MAKPQYDAIVVGGGFFGCSLALHLRREMSLRVAVLEMGPCLMGRASYVNQARVHAGYHYPRSLTTGARSQANYLRFINEFRDCIDRDFTAVYAIARRFSNVTARQFQLFCERIGAPVQPAAPAIRRLFEPSMIEAVFEVTECAFDASKMRARYQQALGEAGVDVFCHAEARSVRRTSGALELDGTANGASVCWTAAEVFNCTYARLNKLLSDSGLPLIPLKHELTELALVEPPPELERRAVTVMCGPFFSVMPFPARGLHSLSHVRYTPHCEWHTSDPAGSDPYAVMRQAPPKSHYTQMVKDAQRYLPAMSGCRYVDSLWEVKTVLPRSETDDSRPILLKRDHGLPNLTCLTGAKLDNVYDVLSTVVVQAAAARSGS